MKKLINKTSYHPLTAIDIFAGCGGLTQGLKQSGFHVVAAVENDLKAADVFSANHNNTFLFREDVRQVSLQRLQEKLRIGKGELDLLAGCPPCQGFSRLGTKNKSPRDSDARNDLIFEFLRLVQELLPRNVMLENVPALAHDTRFERFCAELKSLGYHFTSGVLNVGDYGVPQRRKRLILIASKQSKPVLASPSKKLVSVRDAICGLPPPAHSSDPLHSIKRTHSKAVMKIISLIPKNGGSRSSLPIKLRLDCHKKNDGFKDVYGRMSWDALSPTITTGCTNPSKGRFLHPEQNRAISPREASLLQGFPKNYKFPVEHGVIAISRMIGNALPPPFIERHAKIIAKQSVTA